MATFKYTAREPGGKTIKGTIEGRSQEDAVNSLKRRSLMVLKVGPTSGKKGAQSGLFAVRPSARKGELELFTRQLSTMISAGIPLLESLEILQEQAESPGFTKTLQGVVEAIRTGSDLSAGFGAYPKVFTEVYVSMVRAGEASGQLDDILSRLADYLESVAKLKRDIKSAMMYPKVSLFLVLGITFFLMVVIVPKFKEIFDGLGVELPAVTQVVMGASIWMKTNWLATVGIMAGAWFGFSAWRKTSAGQAVWDRVVLKIPVFGPLFRKVALSRFSRTFATMVKSGVPILGSLEIVAETSGNRVIEGAVSKAMESVRQGETLSGPLSEEPVFPPMVVRMISIGERSGALEALLEKIAEFYDQQVEAEVKALTSLIEPLLIAVMGLLVGGIVLAVFLPIMKLQEALTPK